MADPKTESKFDKLTPEEQGAVSWKAERNLSEQVAKGNKFADKNPEEFLANAREGIASNPDGVRQLVEQHRREVANPSHDKQVAQDVTRALVERGMIDLKGIKFVCDADIDKPTRDGGFECKAPAKSAEKQGAAPQTTR